MDPRRIAAAQGSGLISEVEHRGRRLHVQTEHVLHPEPSVETRVYEGGAVLVRMKVALSVLAEERRITARDVEHLVALQHENLIRKIRHGMLDGDEGGDAPAPPAARPSGVTSDPLEIDDPAVLELLAELERRLDGLRGDR